MNFIVGLTVGALWGFVLLALWKGPAHIPGLTPIEETHTTNLRLNLPSIPNTLEEVTDPAPLPKSSQVAPNWKVLRRIELDRQRRCSAAPPWPVRPSSPRGFALLFATVRNLNTHIIWERWLTDAYNWIHEQQLESPDVPPHQSDILRSYLHYSPAFDRKAVDELMTPMLKGAPIKDPIACVWANTAPCSHRLFEYAYEDWPNAGYFNLLSHNSIPVKPFSVMYGEFLRDQRARVTLTSFCLDVERLNPKTMTWRSLPRPLVQCTLDRPYWTTLGWLKHPTRTGVCDEGFNWIPVMEEFGEGFAELIHPGPQAAFLDGWPSERGPHFHVDCWQTTPVCGALGTNGTEMPINFKQLPVDGFRALMQDPHTWFFRKVSDSALVGDTPMSDWLFEFWNSPSKNLRVALHPNMTDQIQRLKSAKDVDDLILHWKQDNVFGLNIK